MAVWSEIQLGAAKEIQRFDSDYWQPEFMDNERRLAGLDCVQLGDISRSVRSGPFGSNLLCENYVPTGVAVIRPFNLKEFTVSRENIAYIPEEMCVHAGLAFYREGDVMIARVGDVRAGVVRSKDTKLTISPNVIAVRLRDDAISPYYLTAFLNSWPGMTQMLRGMKTVAQPTITTDLVRSIQIPRLRESLQQSIEDKIQEAFVNDDSARTIYAEAEALLESALGLDKLDLTPRLFYERPYADVQTAGRFDAEYFQPRMQNLIAALSRDRQTIGDVAKLSKMRFKPKARGEFRYIEIGDVSGNGTADSNPIASEDTPSRATWIVKPGDILTTTVRPIRRLSAIITDEQSGHVCSSGFAVLTPWNPNDVAPELLLVYLRLPMICELLDLHTTASMYPAIATGDLMKIPIALPKDATRRKVVAKVRESFDARREALRLLEEAKIMVEKAILGGRSSRMLTRE